MRRMIDSSMWSNENFAALPAMARLLQIGMINHADDQGRIKANPLYLSKEIFPYDRVTPTNITKWLELIASNGTVILYTSDGKQYAQLTKWWEYQSLQYASPSDYPPPPTWKDRIRRTATKMVIVTYNWMLTSGVIVPDTCDERGKPLPKPSLNSSLPSTPPPTSNGGSHPPDDSPLDSPEPSPDDSNYSFNLTNSFNLKEERDSVRAQEPARPTTSPPSYRTELQPGEYIPGVKRPQHNQTKRNADEYMGKAAKYGIGPEPFRLMVDSILDATGKTALANTNGDLGQQTLNQAKEAVITLVEMGRRTLEDVQAVLASWRQDDWRGASPPSFGQIVEHASAMAAGTHVTARRQELGKKEFASFADYNDWARHNDPEYKRIREGVVIKGINVKRPNYQPAIAH
jgi:hypothetical protein